MRKQPFVRRDGTVIVGHSAGAWGALALAGESPKEISAIIAFAPGRGGHANDRPNQVCAPQALMAAAAEFGKAARVPVIWLVAANDTYFSPELSRRMADAFRGGGGKVDFRYWRPPAARATGWRSPGRDQNRRTGTGSGAEGARACRGEETMTSRTTSPWPDDDVILYDGVCVFCSRWVRFVAIRDTEQRFRFTAIQSGYGTRLARAFGIDPDDPDTNAVVHGGEAFFKSDAALTVLSNLPGWGWVRMLRAVPKPLRDASVQSRRAQSLSDFREVSRSALCRMRRCGRG